jgi:glycosyltransferase involved in cell wall biosynthesis
MEAMPKLSAIIPTYNEAHNIAAAIDSVAFADEIIVVDSFSTDKTVAIAQEKGVRILQRTYQNSASQKNWTIPQASHEWIVLLDADERIDKELQNEIKAVVADTRKTEVAYWIKRRNFFMGKEVHYSGWQGDKVIRLFMRDKCRYEEKSVHAEVLADGPVGTLKNKLIHNTYKDIFHYLEKWDRYTTWSATDRAKRGENPTLYHFLIKPAFRFFQDYIFYRGILDGMVGFLICALSGMSVFMRSLKVKQMRMSKSIEG